MPERIDAAPSRLLPWPAAVLLLAVSCALLGSPGPPLPDGTKSSRIDFEATRLNELPEGLRPGIGRWAVANSPSAVSGTQLVVHRGDDDSGLTVEAASRRRRIGAEVSVRVLLGPSGAGLACEADGTRYVVKAEPEEARVGLYAGTELVETGPLASPKGEWVRLGIACGEDGVTGYVDGKSVVRSRRKLATVSLELFVDAGVTAHFDDLTFTAEPPPGGPAPAGKAAAGREEPGPAGKAAPAGGSKDVTNFSLVRRSR